MKPTRTDWIQWCWTEGPNPPEGDGWTLLRGDPAVCAQWARSVPAPDDDATHMRLFSDALKATASPPGEPETATEVVMRMEEERRRRRIHAHAYKKLEDEVKALRALLRKHEWAGTWCQGGYGESECPECLADPSDGHKPGCALKAAIG